MIYLAGPIAGCADAECKDWRAKASELLGGRVLDPMCRDYRGQTMNNKLAREIVTLDKADIERASAVLVYFTKPSVGTAMEIHYAWTIQKPVALVNASGEELSPWILHHITARFESLEDACRALRTIE